MSNASVSIKIRSGLTPSDPEQQPVLIVGQAAHLAALSWDDVRCKLEPRVSEEAWRRGLQCVTSSPGDTCELWPRAASLASLPSRRSRHAAPARGHALAKIVRSTQRSTDETIVDNESIFNSDYQTQLNTSTNNMLVCRKRDVLASAVSVARSFPLYHARSAAAPLCPAPAPPAAAPLCPAPAPPAARALALEIHLVKEDRQDGESEEEGLGVLDAALLDSSLSVEEVRTLQDAADATRLAARITDTPANIMSVDSFVEEACKVAKELDIPEPTIIRGEELKARGMGGIYGVGRAAACPPALVSLSYRAPGAADNVAWVGKGIVYDTGGLSIKARTSMVGMKGDCGGAAAVLAAFALAVKARPTVNLHAVLCLAENAVGPLATRPDDIHTLYSGRTVEINNTDAEGRLVLSDGVVYASRDLKADTIVDVATLTGAQGTATGKYHAAIISNSARLESACVTAGLRTGDLAHPLPFAPELHFTEFTSCVADMKNSVADRNNAQPSCAGLFVLSHLGFDFPGRWLHVDMAAPAHCGERATGYGVSLLCVLFGSRTHSRLLRALAPQL